jgi:hypothetical protein
MTICSVDLLQNGMNNTALLDRLPITYLGQKCNQDHSP